MFKVKSKNTRTTTSSVFVTSNISLTFLYCFCCKQVIICYVLNRNFNNALRNVLQKLRYGIPKPGLLYSDNRLRKKGFSSTRKVF